jgi:aminopeptidase N
MSSTDKTAGRVLLPDYIVPSRYDLNLTPDLEAFTFTGTCKITLSTTTIPKADSTSTDSTSKHIVLHAKELCFKAANYVVMVDGKAEAPVECEEVSVADES